jgi:predicted nuclease of predicted toxin-antitoxin system
MKFLIDNALSPDIAYLLGDAGYDAIHVRDIGMATASDEDIFAFAAIHDRVVVSADTDFGTLLALRQETKPSFILFRGLSGRKAPVLLNLVIGHLPKIESNLIHGAVVTMDLTRVRIRDLPIEDFGDRARRCLLPALPFASTSHLGDRPCDE